MINDQELAGFVNGAIARGRITFGDVRRLQRDYLPNGIDTRAQAEMLTALAAGIEDADRSWRQWFATVLTDFATKRAGGDAAPRDETFAWLEQLSDKPGFARRISRKIARQLRRGIESAETTACAIEEASADTIVAQEPVLSPAAQCDEPNETARRKRTRAAKRSRIIVRRRPAKRIRSQNKHDTMPFAMMPARWVWSPLMGAQQLQIRLAAPSR
jgi:hypothetical protein